MRFSIIFLGLLCLLFIITTVDGVYNYNNENIRRIYSSLKPSSTGFRFASYYQDHMVLQQSPASAVIWGYGDLNATVTVVLNHISHSSPVMKGHGGMGIWKVQLMPQLHGGPYNITATQSTNGMSQDNITLHDVMFGEVWVCSGQSNMQMSIQVIFNASYELNQTQYYPNVRVFYVTRLTSEEELYDFSEISIPWSIPTPANINGFSAVCWLYGKYLYDKLKIPIGLVHSSWGGTPVETWSSLRALKSCGLDKSKEPPLPNPNPQNNSIVWNAMIHPLLNMTIKGVVWYQGEQNTIYHRDEYNCSFPAMIKDWRLSWNAGTDGQTSSEFPFGFVQLSVLNEPNWVDDGHYAAIRWHQTADYGYSPNPKMPNTFMAVAIDLLDTGIPYGSPHFRDKQDVSMRLALGSAHRVYGQPIVSDGPFPVNIYDVSVDKILVKYPQRISVNMKTQSFQVCCVPKTCDIKETFSGRTWSNSSVSTWSDQNVILDVSHCPLGVNAIRYAWSVTPCQFKQCQVYNMEGLPAAPFYEKFR